MKNNNAPGANINPTNWRLLLLNRAREQPKSGPDDNLNLDSVVQSVSNQSLLAQTKINIMQQNQFEMP